ncbi:elongation of very long chain fatty acids protein 4-like [Pollicipes pollicipes]|uniref:elongation of very long chain fatty acids protein 4-like n=1 Tax=Pollicipes pollicipes TaxID=41117 RepID=UPI001885206B|nr:elongation of very long chain fatty acids protein 4-like [Pollicipes pollicipes]
MKGRPTPRLRLPLALYNVAQVWLSGYLLHETLVSRPSSWLCVPVDVNDDPRAQRLADAIAVFVLSKMLDFLDTVFLVLRKDHERMTYFHVYHHGSMLFSGWIASVYAPGQLLCSSGQWSETL